MLASHTTNRGNLYRYYFGSRMMDFYARIQNNVLLELDILAWTNVFVVSKALLEDMTSDLAFPQDLRLSKLLRKKAEFSILPANVKVSARKYVNPGKYYRKAGMGKVLAKWFLFFAFTDCVRLIASTSQGQPVKQGHGRSTKNRLPPRNNV